MAKNERGLKRGSPCTQRAGGLTGVDPWQIVPALKGAIITVA